MTIDEAQQLICPVCHGSNPPDAVFCGNPDCLKALGEFDYVIEELRAKSSWIQRVADRVNAFAGHPHFITVHLLWFMLWILLNSSLLAAFGMFDAYPYSLLGIILSFEAILITGFLLISNNRQNIHSDKRAQLDYEVNVRTYRKIKQLEKMVNEVSDSVNRLIAQKAKERQ